MRCARPSACGGCDRSLLSRRGGSRTRCHINDGTFPIPSPARWSTGRPYSASVHGFLAFEDPWTPCHAGEHGCWVATPLLSYCTVHAWRQCVGTQSPRDYRSSSRFSHASNRRTRALRTAPRPLARRSWRARTDVLPLCRHANRMMSRNHGRIRVRAGRSGLAWRQDTWTCIPFDEESVHLPGHRGLVFGPATPPGVVLGLRPPQPTADIDPQARSHPVLRASVSGVGSR